MSESDRLITFTLLGQEFAFYTGASEAEMEAILELVREQVEEISGGEKPGGTIPVSKIAVMACLNLASRYLGLEREFAQYRERTEGKLGQLNARLVTALPEQK